MATGAAPGGALGQELVRRSTPAATRKRDINGLTVA